MINFRAKPIEDVLCIKEDIESFKACGLEYEDGYIYGNLILNDEQPYLVGDIVEANDEYINFEWWIPIQKDTIEIVRESCINDPEQDLKQVLRMYGHTKSERDHLETIVSETIHYLVKQIEKYESEDCEREVKVLNDVINKMQDIQTEVKNT